MAQSVEKSAPHLESLQSNWKEPRLRKMESFLCLLMVFWFRLPNHNHLGKDLARISSSTFTFAPCDPGGADLGHWPSLSEKAPSIYWCLEKQLLPGIVENVVNAAFKRGGGEVINGGAIRVIRRNLICKVYTTNCGAKRMQECEIEWIMGRTARLYLMCTANKLLAAANKSWQKKSSLQALEWLSSDEEVSHNVKISKWPCVLMRMVDKHESDLQSPFLIGNGIGNADNTMLA